MSNVFPDAERKRLFFTLLKVLGGTRATVSFDGSGDSGSIDFVELKDREGHNINLTGARFEWPTGTSNYDHANSKWVKESSVVEMDVYDILKQICEDALESTSLDWYNNEGGYGELNIDLTTEPVSVVLDANIRITTHEHHGFDFTDEGEEESDLDPEAIPLPVEEKTYDFTNEGEKDAPTSS